MSTLAFGARRVTGRALIRLRSAPYLRKWLVLGVVIGVIAGLGAAVFFGGLHLFTRLLLGDLGGYRPARNVGDGGFRLASGFSRPWAVPLVVGGGGLVAGLLIAKLAPEAEGHGTDAAIKAVQTNPKGVRLRAVLVKFLASVVTIGSGGSGGREGPIAQISSGFGSALARVLNLTPADSRVCVAAGIASGIAAIFRAPFGGALLGVELLYLDDMEISALVPSLIASVVSYGVFCAVTGSYTPMFGSLGVHGIHLQDLPLFIGVGLACGIAGRLYAGCFYWTADRFRTLHLPQTLKPVLGGVIVGLIGLVIPGVLGTGYGEIQVQLVLDQLLKMPWLIVLAVPLAKILATSLSIGSGGSGGIFGPGMVIGAATGALTWRFAHLFGLGAQYQLAFAIVGLAACFGATAHAPIAILLMAVEMTGSLDLLPAATVAVAFALLVVGDKTIYRSQLHSRDDAPWRRFSLRPEAKRLTAAEIMAPPRLVLAAPTSVAGALTRMRELQVAGAPVTSPAGTFVGNVQAGTLAQLDAAAQRAWGVGRVANTDAVTLPLDAGFEAVVEALPASVGGWVPVLDDAMCVRGIISAAELLRGARRTMRGAVANVLATAASTTVLEGTLASDSPAAGRTLAELGLPPGTVVLSAARAGAMRFPAADDRLRAGDRLTVLVAPADTVEARARLGLGDTDGSGGDARDADRAALMN